MHAYVWRVNGVDYPICELRPEEFRVKFKASPALEGAWPFYFTVTDEGDFLLWPKPTGPGELLKIEAFKLGRYGRD